jgi:hypothetical protein
LGVTGPSGGLTQAATAAKGTARVTTAGSEAVPTNLYLAYEAVDYSYVSAATQDSNAADSSKLLIALETYLNW